MNWINDTDFSFLKMPVFWSAIAVVIALATFLNLKGRPFWHWRLQRLLNSERKFYDSFPVPAASVDSASEEGMARQYLDAVEEGVSAMVALSDGERRAAAAKLHELVGTLQATHQTLVDSLQPFSESDSKEFVKNWSAVQAKLQSNYFGGKIPSDAHTQCSLVQSIVWNLSSSGNETPTPAMARLQNLRSSVVAQDREVILPVMRSVLDRCQSEVALISVALRDGDARRAIRIKEKYWFDVKHSYKRMQQSLQKMRTLSEEFTRLAAQQAVAPERQQPASPPVATQ